MTATAEAAALAMPTRYFPGAAPPVRTNTRARKLMVPLSLKAAKKLPPAVGRVLRFRVKLAYKAPKVYGAPAKGAFTPSVSADVRWTRPAITSTWPAVPVKVVHGEPAAPTSDPLG